MTGSEPAAEDITQEAFVALFRDLSRYDPARASFTTYLYGIVRNLSRERLRRERRFLSLDVLGPGHEASYSADPMGAREDAELAVAGPPRAQPAARPLSRAHRAVRSARPELCRHRGRREHLHFCRALAPASRTADPAAATVARRPARAPAGRPSRKVCNMSSGPFDDPHLDAAWRAFAEQDRRLTPGPALEARTFARLRAAASPVPVLHEARTAAGETIGGPYRRARWLALAASAAAAALLRLAASGTAGGRAA